jgi:REP element-mobilizing transposase RayT
MAEWHYHRRNLPHFQKVGRIHFVTFCTRDRFVIPEHLRPLVLDHCLHDHPTKLLMHAAVIMPDHVHLLFSPLNKPDGDPFSLSEIMNGIKGASAHSLNRAMGRSGSLWQAESFDRVLRSEDSARAKAEYICDNPVRAGLVKEPDAWPWLWREWIEGEAQRERDAAEGSERGSAAEGGCATPGETE